MWWCGLESKVVNGNVSVWSGQYACIDNFIPWKVLELFPLFNEGMMKASIVTSLSFSDSLKYFHKERRKRDFRHFEEDAGASECWMRNPSQNHMGCWGTQKIRAAISSVSNTAVLCSTFNSRCFQSHCLFWSAVPFLPTAPSIPTDICISQLCECPLQVPFSLLRVTFFFPYLTQLLLIPQTQRKWYFIYLTTTCHMLLYLPGSGTMGINKFHFPSSWTFQLLWSLSWLVK